MKYLTPSAGAARAATRWTAVLALELEDEVLESPVPADMTFWQWCESLAEEREDRRTVEDERTRYTVTLDQYKCMSRSLNRLVDTTCLFPDPDGLHQDVIEKGVRRRIALLKERVFVHFQKTALVTERANEGERKYRRKVVKVGIDPHASYANMLCDVAYARAHTRATFILAEGLLGGQHHAVTEEMNLQGLPAGIVALMAPLPAGEICGRCAECPMGPHGPPERFFCRARNFETAAKHAGCPVFVAAG